MCKIWYCDVTIQPTMVARTWSSLNNALKANIYHKQSNRKGPFSVSNPVPYTVFLIIISHKVKGKDTVFQNHKTVKRKGVLYRFVSLCI